MGYRLSLHVHTKYSKDSNLPFWLLYRKCLQRGIDCIAVTDHDTAEGALAFRRYCQERGGRVHVVVGEEIMTTEGEIIGLFLKETIPPMMTPGETIAAIKRQQGLVYIPHPYDRKRHRSVLKEMYIGKFRCEIDCIECHNGRNASPEYTARQQEIASRYRLLPVAGEDAHTPFEIGRNVMTVPELPMTGELFLRAVRAAVFAEPHYAGFVHHITKVDRILKFVLRGDFVGLCRFIAKKIIQALP